MIFLSTVPVSAYEFVCTQKVNIACGKDALCQLQYFTCCPAAEIHRKQDCEMCAGYWQEERGKCSEFDPHKRKSAEALPPIIMYLLD